MTTSYLASLTSPPTPPHIDLSQSQLTPQQRQTLATLRAYCEEDIVMAVAMAASGHPGGSLSSLDALLMLYAVSDMNLIAQRDALRERVIVSHGHISPGVYAALGVFGLLDRRQFIAHFRQAGAPFGGHIETHIPGVEWNTGNLGQGLSVGCASALAARLRGQAFKSYVMMGDGEQQKGQIGEARRFAAKYRLSNLCVLIDLNGLQIGGATDKVMPTPIEQEYLTAGFEVESVDGHDHEALFQALRRFHALERQQGGKPTALILRTVMGKGIALMENSHHFHGAPPNSAQLAQIIEQKGWTHFMALFTQFKQQRQSLSSGAHHAPAPWPACPVQVGTAHTYGAAERVDHRGAYGAVLQDLARLSNVAGAPPQVLALSCDLEGSVKMGGFHKLSPEGFIESGIAEHHAAVLAGRLAAEGFVTFFSTFGAFAGSESYNQARLTDYNQAPVKVVATHCGLDVGEDGPTHQSIDYVSLYSNLFHFEIFVPADANQADRITRYIAQSNKPAFVAMGRSLLPILTDEQGAPFFRDEAPFVPGTYDCLRAGSDGAIIVMGTLTQEALQAHELIYARSGKRCALYVVASLRPFPEDLVKVAAQTGRIVTVEDHHVETGLGRIVGNLLAAHSYEWAQAGGAPCQFVKLGVNHYGSSGTAEALYRAFGLDAAGITERFIALL